LGHIAEANHDHGRQYFGNRRVDMALLYEQLDEDDVQPDTNDDEHEVPEQLDTAMQSASRKGDMPVQEKPGGKAETKGNEYGGDIGRDRHEA